MGKNKEEKLDDIQEIKFSKAQIVGSTKFTVIEKDILNALLNEDLLYTFDDINELLKGFNKKEVK